MDVISRLHPLSSPLIHFSAIEDLHDEKLDEAQLNAEGIHLDAPFRQEGGLNKLRELISVSPSKPRIAENATTQLQTPVSGGMLKLLKLATFVSSKRPGPAIRAINRAVMNAFTEGAKP